MEREKTYIRGIADEFAEKDLLIAVESIDNQTQKLVYLCLERKGLCLRHSCCCSCSFAQQRERVRGKEI